MLWIRGASGYCFKICTSFFSLFSGFCCLALFHKLNIEYWFGVHQLSTVSILTRSTIYINSIISYFIKILNLYTAWAPRNRSNWANPRPAQATATCPQECANSMFAVNPFHLVLTVCSMYIVQYFMYFIIALFCIYKQLINICLFRKIMICILCT
jgi:hypothetical protein